MRKPKNTFGILRSALVPSVLLLLSPAIRGQSSVTNGLVAYWSFDQNDFTDDVGIFDGTQNGADPIPFVAGKTNFGQAIQLNGVDQFVEITGGNADDLAFAGGSISVAAWFKVGTFDKSWQALVAQGEGSSWRVARRGDEFGIAYAGGATDTPTGTSDVNDGNWHHFVAISDAAAINFGTALYVDGKQYSTVAAAPVLAANGSFVRIGDNPGAPGRNFNGLMDDVAIWNRVLTPNEIASIYNGGAGKPIAVFFNAVVDTDKDGLPDEWETKYGLNPNDATDAAKDLNGNGLSNLEDFKRDLDPTDTTKPLLTSVQSTASFDTLTLTFSKQLDPATATNAANYALSPALAVTGASLKGNVVTLTTAKQVPGATPYTVTVTNVKDINNFPVAANTTGKFFSYIMTKTGVLKFSYWASGPDAQGTAVSLLTDDPRYPASPDLVAAVFSYNSRDVFPDDSHEQYGATIEGLITPTESGDYRFFLYSDDSSQLFLSTDDKEANLVQIAEETGCCNVFTEPDSPRTSEPIALVAGKSYFTRLIYKEGGGGDYGQVAWRKEGDKTPAASLKPIPGKYLSSAVDLPAPAEGSFSIQSPGINAKNVSPASKVTIAHIDGKTAWTSNNVSLKFNGTSVAPTFTKDGTLATIVFTPSALLPSNSTNTVTLTYPDPSGAPATQEWTFVAATYAGPLTDSVKQYPGLIMGSAKQSADKGGHSAAAGDKGLDLGNKGGAAFFIPDASWLNTAAANNEMSFSIWVKRYDINASSAFWAASPSSNNSERGWQAHTPWSDNTVYFDTAGCCDADVQRINANIDTLPGFTGDTTDVSWWTNSWHHFVFEKKGDVKDIYIDGQLFLEGSGTAPLPTDFTTLYLGADNTGVGNMMHGQVDDFAVYGTALSAADVTKLFTGTAPTALGTASKLMAYWDFNSGGTTPPSGIKATIAKNGANITIQWAPAGGTLESSPTLGTGAVWTPVGTTNPATVPVGAGNLFYRIKQ